MSKNTSTPYRCPICHESLSNSTSGLKCGNGHSFDRAKEGYVHLLPANRKHSRDPGDDKQMVQARRRFLDAGHYRLLKEALGHIATVPSPDRILDIGCGEGYFSGGLATHYSQADVYALDISKNAVRLAAKRYKDVSFCIASSKDLPFEDNSLDLVTRVYAPSDDAELHRVIRPQGQLIIATPGPDHLLALRKEIYDEVRPHQEEIATPEGFSLSHHQRMTSMLSLTGEQALDLLQMTPFAWRANTAIREKLATMATFECEIDFVLHCFTAK